MARYHFNPETGKASACRAKPGNCPFVTAGAQHFDTLEEARAGVERYFTEEYASNIARYAILYNRIQHHILASKDDDESWEAVLPYITERDALERFIRDMKPESYPITFTLDSTPQRLIHGALNRDDGEHRIIGFGNDVHEFRGAQEKTFQAALNLSEDWVSKLDAEEAHAVVEYSGNADALRGKTAIIDRALAKAPRLEPTIVYSGLSKHVANDVLSQLDSGLVKLDYHISTSLNAAQVNGFMEHTGTDEELMATNAQGHHVAVEIETTVGGSMMAVSHSLQEFEVLLPSGEYEVIGVRENVETHWDDNGMGRTAQKLIKLRRIA